MDQGTIRRLTTRRTLRRAAAGFGALLSALAAGAIALEAYGARATPEPIFSVRLVPGQGTELTHACFVFSGLEASDRRTALSPGAGPGIIAIYPEDAAEHLLGEAGAKPLAGRFEPLGSSLRFTPDAALEAGGRYRVVYRAGGDPGRGADRSGPVVTFFTLPPKAATR